LNPIYTATKEHHVATTSEASSTSFVLPADRYFDPDPHQKALAQRLYEQVAAQPLVCPHGHVDPRMFADPEYQFGSPADLLLIPDHYIFRMLYSQGIALESLGVPRTDGGAVESDHRKIWQIFADNFYLFRGTPTGMWLTHELIDVFGVREKLTSASAQRIYDQIADCLSRPEFRPRALFERFNISVLATTDAAHDKLEYHQAIRASGWQGRVVPTFRPDGVVNIDRPDWRAQ
jgi:glucuronate isomerase